MGLLSLSTEAGWEGNASSELRITVSPLRTASVTYVFVSSLAVYAGSLYYLFIESVSKFF